MTPERLYQMQRPYLEIVYSFFNSTAILFKCIHVLWGREEEKRDTTCVIDRVG